MLSLLHNIEIAFEKCQDSKDAFENLMSFPTLVIFKTIEFHMVIEYWILMEERALPEKELCQLFLIEN